MIHVVCNIMYTISMLVIGFKVSVVVVSCNTGLPGSSTAVEWTRGPPLVRLAA